MTSSAAKKRARKSSHFSSATPYRVCGGGGGGATERQGPQLHPRDADQREETAVLRRCASIHGATMGAPTSGTSRARNTCRRGRPSALAQHRSGAADPCCSRPPMPVRSGQLGAKHACCFGRRTGRGGGGAVAREASGEAREGGRARAPFSAAQNLGAARVELGEVRVLAPRPACARVRRERGAGGARARGRVARVSARSLRPRPHARARAAAAAAAAARARAGQRDLARDSAAANRPPWARASSAR